MSKSLWSRSVWNSLFNRAAGSRRSARKLRRSRGPVAQHSIPVESLEQRVVLAAAPIAIQFDDAGTGTLHITSTDGGSTENVTVKAGAAFTDVLVGGKLTARLEGISSSEIGTINFNGKGGTDSLSVTGIDDTLIVNLTGVERLQLNTTDVTVNSVNDDSTALTLVTSTVTGSLTVFHDANIVQSGKLIVSGVATLEAGGGADDITLKTTGNSFGSLDLLADDATITEVGPTDFENTVINGSLTVVSSGAISAGAGDLTINGTAADSVSLTSNGSSIDVTAAITDNDIPVSLKGSNITLTDTLGDITLKNVTASANFDLTTSDADTGVGQGNITQVSGKITVGGIATIDAGTDNITLTGGTNNVGSWDVTGANISITEKSSTNFAAVEASGSLAVISSGAITDSGEVNVGTTTNLTAKSAPITLDDAANTFGGTITSSGTNITLVDTNATDLGVTTAKGTFTLTSGGGVSQSGNLTVSGLFSVDATGDPIDLNDGPAPLSLSNKFGSISVIGTVVDIEEADASNIFNSTVATSFQLVSGGAVTDSGTMINTGTTTITAAGGKSITLDDAESAYGGGPGDTINLTTTGTGVLVNTVASELGNISLKSFTLTSDGNVSQTADTTISITGRLTINAVDEDNLPAHTITLNAADSGGAPNTDKFGSMSLFGTTVTVFEDDASDLFNSQIDGNFSLTSLGAVTDSGVVKVDGTTTILADSNGATVGGTKQNITLNSVGSLYGDAAANELNLDGAIVYVADYSDETNLGVITTSGALTISAFGEDGITDDGIITVGGNALATFNANGNDITLNNTGSQFTGSISLFGAAAILTTGADAKSATSADVVLGTTKVDSLTVTTADAGGGNGFGDVTQSGAIQVLDQLVLNTTSGNVNLTTNGFNSFGSIGVTLANNVAILERGDMVLDDMTIDGTLDLTATGGITDDDNGVLNVDGIATINANGGDLFLLSLTSEFNDRVNLVGDNIEITNKDTTGDGFDLGTLTASGYFTLTSTATGGATNGAVTQSGDAVVGGLASITASETGTGAQDITLDQTNSFGKIAFDGATVIIDEADADGTLISESAEATGNLTITSLGDVTSEVEINVTGVTTVSADGGAGLIELTDEDNTFTGALVLSGSAVTIKNDTATILGTATGEVDVESLTLTSGGAVTQGGDVTVVDLLNIDAAGSAVDLNNGTDSTSIGTLRVVAASADILDDADDLTLDGVTLSGNLTINATDGSVIDATGTDSGTIEVGGTTTITADADIILDHTFGGGSYETESGAPDSTFAGVITLDGVNVFLAAVDDLLLGDISADGDLTIATDGDVTNVLGGGDYGVFTVVGSTTIDVTLGGAAGIISLDLFNGVVGVTPTPSDFGDTPVFLSAPGNLVLNPGLIISTTAASFAASTTGVVITFTFDANVTGFDINDIAIATASGTATFTPNPAAVAGSGSVYTITGDFGVGTGSITINVAANKAFHDPEGVGNLAATTLTINVI